MSKRLLTLALICLSVSACSELPEFPSVETKLVDNRNAKLHRYELPKERGQSATFLGSVTLDTRAIEKHYCFAAREYVKVEQYISAVEDVARRRCR